MSGYHGGNSVFGLEESGLFSCGVGEVLIGNFLEFAGSGLRPQGRNPETRFPGFKGFVFTGIADLEVGT
ncbi:MAG: hypothetical protein ABIT37_21030 [Luteolibacter sp.]